MYEGNDIFGVAGCGDSFHSFVVRLEWRMKLIEVFFGEFVSLIEGQLIIVIIGQLIIGQLI